MWREGKSAEENKAYKDMIDELVNMIRNGQGQIGSNRARNGIWNSNAKRDGLMDDQYEYNELLKRLPQKDRSILAKMLEKQVETGVFETLKLLEEKEIKPFDEGFEGSPYEDFIGRMSDWGWPKDR